MVVHLDVENSSGLVLHPKLDHRKFDEENGGHSVKNVKAWCQAQVVERVNLRRVAEEWWGTEKYICGWGDVHVPNEREYSVSDQDALLE